jgi:Ca2+-binding RTX toxin-like protein
LSVTYSSLAKLVGGLGNDTFVLNSTDSNAGVSQGIGYNEIADFSTSDVLDLQDSSASLNTVAKWDLHATFFTTGGTNLVVQFTSTTNSEQLVFDGLGGKGFTSFASMVTGGYHITVT